MIAKLVEPGPYLLILAKLAFALIHSIHVNPTVINGARKQEIRMKNRTLIELAIVSVASCWQ